METQKTTRKEEILDIILEDFFGHDNGIHYQEVLNDLMSEAISPTPEDEGKIFRKELKRLHFSTWQISKLINSLEQLYTQK